MPDYYDEIGQRLRAFRLSTRMGTEEISRRLGISRTALYRFERGDVVKLETLEKLAELLEVSVPTLLGVDIEYIPSAVTYFERVRQIEEEVEQITALAGPISFLLSSDAFMKASESVLVETVPMDTPDRAYALEDVAKISAILRERKRAFRQRQPTIINLISAVDIERFLRNGFVGKALHPESLYQERRELARAEVEHFAALIEEQRLGVQIGITTTALPHAGFEIFRQPKRKILTVSPFRVGDQPNVRVGVAMITSSAEALALHEKIAKETWRDALKGSAAVAYLRNLLRSTPA